MKKQKFFHLTSQVYICKGTAEQEVYLVQVHAKDKRDLSKEEIKKIPDSDSLFEMNLYDIISSEPEKPLESQFTLQTYIKKDFGLGNKCF